MATGQITGALKAHEHEIQGQSAEPISGWQPTWYAAGPVEFAAYGDRLLIIEDPFKSGYECKRCGGKDIRGETSVVTCTECGGAGEYSPGGKFAKRKCSACEGRGVVACPDCGGKGGLIIVPDE